VLPPWRVVAFDCRLEVVSPAYAVNTFGGVEQLDVTELRLESYR
jgi:hypothetical protein